jgi:hypothetical protein
MRCFYHEDKQAVGICKSCGKGVCQECAVDFTKGLACRGHCEESVRSIIQKIDEYNKNFERYSEQLEQSQKQFEIYKAALEQSEKDKEQWRKAMSDYENRRKFTKPPDVSN